MACFDDSWQVFGMQPAVILHQRMIRMACSALQVWKMWLVAALVIAGSNINQLEAQAFCNKTVTDKTFEHCSQLVSLGAKLAWTFHVENHTIDFAFTEDANSLAGWVGWGINPTSGLMPGTQALVAFWDAAQTHAIVKEYDLTVNVAYGPETPLYPATNLSVLYTNTSTEATGTLVTIFTTLHLAQNQSASLNHVWNRGFRVVLATLSPVGHDLRAENRASRVNIDMVTGAFTSISDHEHFKNAHGIVNVISWGMLMPLGVMMARYLPLVPGGDSLWFHLHRGCQTVAYIVGVVGFGMGCQLQAYEPVLLYHKHRDLGVSIVVCATLQVLALILRPHKDNKWRLFWKVYHQVLGHATILLIIVNVGTGIDILDPRKRYRIAYATYLCFLGGVSILLEAILQVRWSQNRRREHAINGLNP